MRKILLSLSIVICACGWMRGEEKSRLVVGIVVSHFYPEWLEMFHKDLTEGGLKRLVSEGASFSMNYNYMYTQTGVDHASIYTGMMPADHGIVGTAWYDRLRGKRQYSTSSENCVELGELQVDSLPSLSPAALQALSLGSFMKLHNPLSKVYSIAMNGDEAVLSGGSSANMAFWYSEKTGKWVSSSYYGERLPEWLEDFNEKVESDDFVNRGWMSLADESRPSIRVRLGNHFYYDIAQAKREYKTYRVLKATPYANTLVRQLAVRLIGEERLGADADPDLLALNFSCLDYMFRDFQVDAAEERDVVMRLDRDIEALLKYLDMKVGEENYTVFLTFSEARELTPEDLRRVRLNTGYFSIFRAVALLKSYLGLVYGEGEWIVDYDQVQIYLNRELIEKRGMELKEVQDRVADFLIEFEGVAKVVTAYSLTHATFPEGMSQLMQNAFSRKRSGDVLFCLHPTWMPELRDVEDTYFRYSKRYRVPLYLWGNGVKAGKGAEVCQMIDLLPTLCRIMGLPIPYTSIGTPL